MAEELGGKTGGGQARPKGPASAWKRAVFAASAAFLVVVASAPVLAHEPSLAGEPGDPSKPARTVEVVMSDDDGMRFTPNRIEANRGEQIKFVIRNAGKLAHEFFFGSAEEIKSHAAMMAKMPDMKHNDPNAKTLEPGLSATILWRFPHKGEFEFACLIPGHYELGMRGIVAVK